MKNTIIFLILTLPLTSFASTTLDYQKSVFLNEYITEQFIETGKLDNLEVVEIFETILATKEVPLFQLSNWHFLEEVVEYDLLQFSKNISKCAKRESETRDILTGMPVQRAIKGLQNGSCIYEQTVNDSFHMVCNYPSSVLKTLSHENLKTYNAIRDNGLWDYELSINDSEIKFWIGDEELSDSPDLAKYCEVNM